MGMDEICITDHVDYGIKEDWDSGKEICYRNGEPLANVDYPVYMAELDRMRELYGDQIAIKTGLEFGMQMHTIPKYEALFRKYPFDFIILSVHQVDDLEFWTQDFQRGRTQREYNERYYKELLSLVKGYKNYSVLGHLDLIVRYDEAGVYPFEKVRPLIEEILKTVIADGKGIEVNTSPVKGDSGIVPRTGRRDPYGRKRQPQTGTSGNGYTGDQKPAERPGVPEILHV